MTVIVNKHVWMHCFGKEVPCEEQLIDDIQRLRDHLQILDIQSSIKLRKKHSQLQNSLKRCHKMLAAVKDGQPWAWMLYPVPSEYSETTELD